MVILSKVLIPKRKNYMKIRRPCDAFQPINHGIRSIFTTTAPHPPTSLNSSSPVTVTVIVTASVGAGFVVNRGLVALAVMFFVTTAQN